VLLNPPTRNGIAVVRDTFYGCWCKGRADYNWPPINLATVGATLKKEGYPVSLVDGMAMKWDVSQTVDNVVKEKPDYIIVCTATITFSSDVYVVKEVKKALPDTKVIFIGTHVTTMPKPTLKEEAVDYVIVGEPDFILRDVINALEDKEDIEKIRGVAFRKNGEIIITGMGHTIDNLDDVPFPARELIPNAEYFNPVAKRLPYTTMLSSRGCPALCTFCSAVTLYGHKFRARSPKNVVDEIEQCVKELGIREVFFRDETFTFNKKRAIEICKEMIDRKIDITFIINSRVNTVDDDTLYWLKKAGCHLIKFGVESGSQQILDNIKKGEKLETIRNAYKMCKKIGFETWAFFILGLPGETKDTIKNTIKFAKEIDPDFPKFHILKPYPNSDIYKELMEKNLIDDFDYEKYGIHTAPVHHLPDLNAHDLIKWQRKAYRSARVARDHDTRVTQYRSRTYGQKD